MKSKLYSRLLLVAISNLTISMSARTQDLPSTSGIHHQRSYERENFHTGPKEQGENLLGIYPHEKFGNRIHHQTPEQLTIVQLNDSIYTWRWDTTILGWAIESKIINIAYDVNNNLTFFTSQKWDGSAWGNGDQFAYTYDANNNQVNELSQYWDGSHWENSYQYTYTYDANNNLTNELYQHGNGGALVNDYQYTSTYDANNNLTSVVWQHWYGNHWVISSRSTYTYDANNNQTNVLFQQKNGNDWVNFQQFSYTYDLKNNQTSASEQAERGKQLKLLMNTHGNE